MIPLLLFARSKALILSGVIILLTFTHSYAYFSGLESGREELALYKLTMKAIGDAQEAKTKQVIISQQQIANEANDEATKLRAALNAYFDDPRVQVNYGSSSRKLPSVPKTTGGTNATPSEPRVGSPRDEAPEKCVTPVSAARDALDLLLWQKWAEKNMGAGR